MIERMKKVWIIALSSRRRIMLAALRSLGVLHIDDVHLPDDASPELKRRIQACRRSLEIIDEHVGRSEQRPIETTDDDAEKIAATITEGQRHIDDLYAEMAHLSRLREKNAVWGDFDPDDLELLQQRGIELRFSILAPRQFRRARRRRARLFVVRRQFGRVYSVQVILNAEQPLDAEAVVMPEMRLGAIDRRLAEIDELVENHRHRIVELSRYRDAIERRSRRLDRLFQFRRLRRGMRWEHQLICLGGYLPASDLHHFRAKARRYGWGLVIDDPQPDDPTPTKVRNRGPIAIIAPVFRFLGTLPGYKEQDISIWFLPFFTLFFAMIIGDGGYGILIAIAALLFGLRRRRGSRAATGALLLGWLGCATIIWGAITGTWFGHPPLARDTLLARLVIPSLDSFEPRSIPFVQWFCFVIGTAHITIAHAWRFIITLRSPPRLRAIAELGWMAMQLGLYSLVISLVLSGEGFFRFDNFIWFIIIGGGLILLFARQEGTGLFKGILAGIKGIFITFLDGISSFGDIISYVRLFAVGLASVEIARSFNTIAVDIGDGPLAIAATILVLGLGHALNLTMGGLSVIVHGIRLNMLEFSGHLGMEWSGIPYRPFSADVRE